MGMAEYYLVLPTPLTDALNERNLNARNEWEQGEIAGDVLASHEQLERDVMTLALRLYAESDDTFSPETIECMARWRPVIKKMLDDELAGEEREGIV